MRRAREEAVKAPTRDGDAHLPFEVGIKPSGDGAVASCSSWCAHRMGWSRLVMRQHAYPSFVAVSCGSDEPPPGAWQSTCEDAAQAP